MAIEIFVPGVTFIIDTDDEYEALSEVNDRLGEVAWDWIEPVVGS